LDEIIKKNMTSFLGYAKPILDNVNISGLGLDFFRENKFLVIRPSEGNFIDRIP